MKRLICAAALAAAGLAVAGNWEPFAGNPVLGNRKLGTCFDVNVVTNGPAPYTMYFSWRPKKAIALVRSADGLSWTQEPEICLEANPASGWEDDLNRSCTVYRDGVWHMWYTGQSKGWSRIGYATSTDGVHFTRVRREPVLVPEHPHETPSTMNPYVRWDEARGVWRMWYAGGEQHEPNVLCYAESEDGLTWRKWEKNPFFTKGPEESWDRDRVGACEVHPLPDGRWAMFYIGYSDIDTARIGCAISADGLTGWKRLPQNPIVAPDLGTWNASACYKPSVVRDEKNNRWMLWYNGRNGAPEYVGLALHEGLDLEAPARAPDETVSRLSDYVRRFNADDVELYTNAIPNAAAEAFLLQNVPRFACPDKDIERTYYFRWWTFRKHLRKGGDGDWRVTEFLPKVSWSGADNTIVCPAGHHLREGRWLHDAQILADNARFWLADPSATHRWDYASWLFTGTELLAEVTGRDTLPVELLDDAVRYWERWEKGFTRDGGWPMGGDGKGGFLSIDNREGTEYSLGGNGYKPLFLSAMWREARTIAAVARRSGRTDLAERFDAKAEGVRQSLLANCWNPDVGFFTTRPKDGARGTVRELHGYAPWYFGVPTDGRAPDWGQLADPQGFAARFGLTFPERRAKGFALDYKGHECKWNGPSWPYATSVALTAFANDLHTRGGGSAAERERFGFLLWQYAAQQKRTQDWRTEGDFRVVPWIDENLHPDKSEWIARKIILDTPAMRDRFPKERGKDYNHSTFCDLVISGLVGLVPDGARGFAVDPLCPQAWDWFVLEDVRYRGHAVSVRWQRGEGLTVTVDGRVTAQRPTLGRLDVKLSGVGVTAARPVPRKALLDRLNDGPDVYGIVHWGLNTYTDREWGYGDEDPKALDPKAFDADQIVGACRDGGLGGLIIVAKHHDGFCLWPTKTTEHNITRTPFRGGKGDYVREMERACRQAGLKFGVYVSPWDRNSAHYGTEKYVELYHAQIRELLSGDYGEVFEMWFDGANGGDGWYGGARERRTIPANYYRFDEVFTFVRALQPNVSIFAGENDLSDFRWPGNERGELINDSRATVVSVGGFVNGACGNPDYAYLINSGLPSGAFFRVCEADFPLRRGWFYHERERGTTKSPTFLMKIYLRTVGNGGMMNIGIAPNRDGRLDDEDVCALRGFAALKAAFFAHEVTEDAQPFNAVVLSEDLSKGEQVDHWTLLGDGVGLVSGRAIGRRRIRILDRVVAPQKVELRVTADGGDLQPVTIRRYLVPVDLLERLRQTADSGEETDTAKWMTQSTGEKPKRLAHVAEPTTVARTDFRIRDPFVLAEDGTYYLYESKPWSGGRGVAVRTSKDLERWSEKKPVLELSASNACTAVWAPEVHRYDGAYWLFVTLTFDADAAHPLPSLRQDGFTGGKIQPRGVWVFRSDSPLGPFKPVKAGSVTPSDWMCLDGTLWIENGEPWMVFCHEWCQTGNGRMMAAPLSRDLARFTAEPIELFRAADAPGGEFVTDGPFLVRTKGGVLRLIWSNLVKGHGYSVLQCASESGTIRGPWKHLAPLYTRDGGHGMLFRTFAGELTLALHQPNTSPNERMRLYPVEETPTGLKLKSTER